MSVIDFYKNNTHTKRYRARIGELVNYFEQGQYGGEGLFWLNTDDTDGTDGVWSGIGELVN